MHTGYHLAAAQRVAILMPVTPTKPNDCQNMQLSPRFEGMFGTPSVRTQLDPLSRVNDVALLVSPNALQQLHTLLQMPEKFSELPGVDTANAQTRLTAVFNALLVRLIADIRSHPSKLWVLLQFQVALKAVLAENPDARALFGLYLECIMDTLHIDSADGVLDFYR